MDQRFQEHSNRFDDLKEGAHKDAIEIMKTMIALHERVRAVEVRQGL